MVGLSLWLSIWLLCGSVAPALAIEPCHTWSVENNDAHSLVKCARDDAVGVAVEKTLTVERVLRDTCKMGNDASAIAPLFDRAKVLETCTAAPSSSLVSFDVKLRCKFHPAKGGAEIETQDKISSTDCEEAIDKKCKHPLRDERSLMYAIQRACAEKLGLFDSITGEPLCPEFMAGDAESLCEWELSHKGDHVSVDVFEKVKVAVSYIPLTPGLDVSSASDSAVGPVCKLPTSDSVAAGTPEVIFVLSQEEFTRNYVKEKISLGVQNPKKEESQAAAETEPKSEQSESTGSEGATNVLQLFHEVPDVVDEQEASKMEKVEREGIPLATLERLLFGHRHLLETCYKDFAVDKYLLTCSERGSTRLAKNRVTQDDACLYIKFADLPKLELRIEPVADLQVHFPRESGAYGRYVARMPLTIDSRKQAGAEPETSRPLAGRHMKTVLGNTWMNIVNNFGNALNQPSRGHPKQAVKLFGSNPPVELEVFEALFYCFQDVQDPRVRFYLPFASTPFTTWRDLKVLLAGRRNVRSAGPKYSSEDEPLTLFYLESSRPVVQVRIESSMDDEYINVADRMEPFVFGVSKLLTNVILFHFPESSPAICLNSPLVYDGTTEKPTENLCKFEFTDFVPLIILSVAHTDPSFKPEAVDASAAPAQRLCVFRRRLSDPRNPWEEYPEAIIGMNAVSSDIHLQFRTNSLLLPRACCLAFGEPPRRCQLVEEFSDTLALNEDGKGLSSLEEELIPLKLVHTDQVLVRLHRAVLPKYNRFPPPQPLTDLYLNRDAHFKTLINSCKPKQIESEKERKIVNDAGLLSFRCTGADPLAEPDDEPRADSAGGDMLSRLTALVEAQLRNGQQKCPTKVTDLYFLKHKGHSLSSAHIEYDVMVIEEPLGDATCKSACELSSSPVGSASLGSGDGSAKTQQSISFNIKVLDKVVKLELSRDAIGGGLPFAFIKDLISIRESGKGAPEKSVLKVTRQLAKHVGAGIESQMTTFKADPSTPLLYTFELRDTDPILSLSSLSATDYVSSWVFSLVTPPSLENPVSTVGPEVPTYDGGRIKILRSNKLGQGAFGMVVRAERMPEDDEEEAAQGGVSPLVAASSNEVQIGVEDNQQVKVRRNERTAARRKQRHQELVAQRPAKRAAAQDSVLELPEVREADGKELVAKLFKCDAGTTPYDGFFTEVYVNRQIEMRHKELRKQSNGEEVKLGEYLPVMVTYGLLSKSAAPNGPGALQRQCSFMYIVYTSGGKTTLDNALFVEARKRTFFSPTKFAMAIASDLKIFASAALRLAEAVQYLSNLGIYHYDLKPANIMLTMDPEDDPDYKNTIASMKLIDIGVVLDAQVAKLPEKSKSSPNPLKWLEIDKFPEAAKTLYDANLKKKQMKGAKWTVKLRDDLHQPPTTTPARTSPLMYEYDGRFTVYQLGLIFVELLLGVPIQATADAIVLDFYAAYKPVTDSVEPVTVKPTIFRTDDDCPNRQLFLQEKRGATIASINHKANTEGAKPGSERYEQILQIAQHFSYTKVLRESAQKERIKELIIEMLNPPAEAEAHLEADADAKAESDAKKWKSIDTVVKLLREILALSPSDDVGEAVADQQQPPAPAAASTPTNVQLDTPSSGPGLLTTELRKGTKTGGVEARHGQADHSTPTVHRNAAPQIKAIVGQLYPRKDEPVVVASDHRGSAVGDSTAPPRRVPSVILGPLKKLTPKQQQLAQGSGLSLFLQLMRTQRKARTVSSEPVADISTRENA